MSGRALFALPILAAAVHAGVAAAAPADLVYRNGVVYTVDAHDSVHGALAVRGGRIAWVGSDAGVAALVGPRTRVIDLHGRMLMPGLVDAHMHPQSGGSRLLDCSLDYRRLTVPQFQARIQACLDRGRKHEPNRPLLVVNWFQQGMQPDGVATSAATLDALAKLKLVGSLRLGSAVRFDPNTTPHHHAVCDACGIVVDLPAPPLPSTATKRSIERAAGFEVRAEERTYRGLCSRCVSLKGPPGPDTPERRALAQARRAS